MAEIGIEFVVPPPAVEKLPTPSNPPEVRLVDPIIPTAILDCDNM